MQFRVTENELRKIGLSESQMLLGIILTSGEVLLALADESIRPGHQSWVERDHLDLDSIYGGFSIIADQGRVRCLFKKSTLNQHEGRILSEEDVEGIIELFPCTEDCRFFGD